MRSAALPLAERQHAGSPPRLVYPALLPLPPAAHLGDRPTGPSLRPAGNYETPEHVAELGVVVKDPGAIRAPLQAHPGVVVDRLNHQRREGSAQSASVRSCRPIS